MVVCFRKNPKLCDLLQFSCFNNALVSDYGHKETLTSSGGREILLNWLGKEIGGHSVMILIMLIAKFSCNQLIRHCSCEVAEWSLSAVVIQLLLPSTCPSVDNLVYHFRSIAVIEIREICHWFVRCHHTVTPSGVTDHTTPKGRAILV